MPIEEKTIDNAVDSIIKFRRVFDDLEVWHVLIAHRKNL